MKKIIAVAILATFSIVGSANASELNPSSFWEEFSQQIKIVLGKGGESDTKGVTGNGGRPGDDGSGSSGGTDGSAGSSTNGVTGNGG